MKDRMEETAMTKRFVSPALAVLMMILAVYVPAAMAGDESPNAHAGTYYVQTDNGKGLNVRDNPDGRVVGSLKYGTPIYVDAFTAPEWALITYRYDNGFGMDDYSAYVSTRYLVRSDPGEYQGSSSSSSYPLFRQSWPTTTAHCLPGKALRM